MATPQSPFSFLDGLFERVAAGPQPPQWLVHEMQQRIVLFLNHVLMQEKEAMDRLVRQKGRIARVQWRAYSMALVITPAGLFNLAHETAAPDLQLHVTETSPFALAQTALRGDKPAIRIEGDVQLAAEINWLGHPVGGVPVRPGRHGAGQFPEALAAIGIARPVVRTQPGCTARPAAALGAGAPGPHLRQVWSGAFDTPRPAAARCGRRAGPAAGPRAAV